MSARIWRTARWFLVLGVGALLVMWVVPMALDALSGSLVFGDAASDEDGDGDGELEGDPADPDREADDPAEPVGEVPTGPVSDGQAVADADFALRDGVVRQEGAEVLTLSQQGDAAVVVFPLIDGDPGCVRSVEFELGLREADPTPVAVYAAGIHAPLADGDAVDDARLDGTVHALGVTDGSPGRLRWDVTDLYRSWAAADLAPPGTPFAVVVSAPPDDPAALTFSALEAGADDAPTLAWEGEPGCGEDVV